MCFCFLFARNCTCDLGVSFGFDNDMLIAIGFPGVAVLVHHWQGAPKVLRKVKFVSIIFHYPLSILGAPTAVSDVLVQGVHLLGSIEVLLHGIINSALPFVNGQLGVLK